MSTVWGNIKSDAKVKDGRDGRPYLDWVLSVPTGKRADKKRRKVDVHCRMYVNEKRIAALENFLKRGKGLLIDFVFGEPLLYVDGEGIGKAETSVFVKEVTFTDPVDYHDLRNCENCSCQNLEGEEEENEFNSYSS